MGNKQSDKDNKQANDQDSPSSSPSGQPNSPNKASSLFDFSSFGQSYLNQLQQMSQLNASFPKQANHTSNPIETNMQLWQNSIKHFSNFMMPKANNPSDTQHSNQDNQTPSSTDSQLGDFNDLAQRFFSETLKRNTMNNKSNHVNQSLMLNLVDGWQYFATGVTDKSPTVLLEQQLNLWQQQAQLYQNTLTAVSGNQTKPLITPEKGDKRFSDEEWSSNPTFDFLKQSYLLTVDSIMNTINDSEGVDDKTRQRLSFFTRQWLNAVAPSNFLWSNPEILRLTLESKGQNLVKGLEQLTEDMEKSSQMLSISMTDDDAFELGEISRPHQARLSFATVCLSLSNTFQRLPKSTNALY